MLFFSFSNWSNCSIVVQVSGPDLFLALNEYTTLCTASSCSHYSVICAKLRKASTVSQLPDCSRSPYCQHSLCFFLNFIFHFSLCTSSTCYVVHGVRQVRVVLQMFPLQGLGLRGLAMELICP